MEEKKSKKLPIIISAAVALVIVIVIFIIALGGHRVIKIKNFLGTVALERGSSDKDIVKGMNLKSADKVTTGEDGIVELLVDEDKHIMAQNNTCFKIIAKGDEDKGKLKIKLEYGTALVEIKKKLPEGAEVELDTPNASISVRGTIFETSYVDGDDTTVVKVTNGVVKVASDTQEMEVPAGKMATVKDDEITVEPLPLEYRDVEAFEARYASTEEPSGIHVKELVGWTTLIRSSQDDELTNNGVIIRYWVDTEEGVNRNKSDSRNLECIDEEYSLENGDGQVIYCRKYGFNGRNGDIEIAYMYYKQISADMYLCIMVYDEDDGDSLADADIYTYLQLTNNCYYIYDDNVLDILGEGVNSDSPEAVYEDITSFDHSEDVTFYLKKWGTDEAAGVGVKQLTGWEYYTDGDDNEFRKERVNIEYDAYSAEKYTSVINMLESEGYVLEYLQNDDGDTIICHATEKVIEDFERRDYKYYKQVSEDVYIGLLVNYDNYIDSIVDTNLSTFLPLTNDEYYVIEENATPNVGEGTTVSDEELPNLIKGEVNRGQLEYLLDVAETCRFDGNEDYIYTGLDILWYMYYRDVVVPKDGSSFTSYTYDLAYLNNLYSALTDDVIGENNIPSVASINGNELVFDPCTITMGGGVSTTINKVTQYENNQLIVEYNFIKTTGSDGMIGVKGISKAYFTKNSDGKYVFDHIEEVSSEDFNYN